MGRKRCNLVCDIAAKRVEKRLCTGFTTHVQTFLATNQVVAGCEKLLQNVESSLELFYFCKKKQKKKNSTTQGKVVLQQVM